MSQSLPQLCSFRLKIGQGLPVDDAQDITGRRALKVDRLQARLVVEPSGTGTTPAPSDVAALERLIRFRLALDRNDRRVVTSGEGVPVDAMQQLSGGPVAVPSFTIQPGDQPKVRLSVPPNTFQNAIFNGFGTVWFELLFWGQEV
jgi:hypothetical protein